MKTPRSVDLDVTNRCNLRCKYCYHFTSAGDVGKDLPVEEWLEFFEELTRCAVTNVTIAGGEPFYREDLKELIDGVVRNRLRFNLLSNGTLITDEIAAYLASTGRCDGVQVSIDGSIPITHDSFRGKGNFVKAMSGIRTLLKHKLSVPIRVTIHRKNVHDLEGVARLLLEEIGLPSFSTNSAGYMGLCQQNTEQVQLTAEEFSLAMETLLKLGLYGQHGSGAIRISRMNTHGINILYKAYCDHLILGISNNLKFQFFPSEDRLLDKDLPDRTEREASTDNSTEFLDIINQTTACSAHGISRSYNAG